MSIRSLLVLCFTLCASYAYAKDRLLKDNFSGWSCNNGIIYNSAGAVAAANGNHGGGPWSWLGGNSCQASAEAIAGTGFNRGAFAAADAQAFSGGRKLLWNEWDRRHDHDNNDDDNVFSPEAVGSRMKTVVWVLVSPMLHAIAFFTALVCVTIGTILGRLTPQQLDTTPNGSVEGLLVKNEATGPKQQSQQPSSEMFTEEGKAERAGREVLEEISRSPSVEKERCSWQDSPQQSPTSQCRPCPHRTLQDLDSKPLTYDIMARLALAAAEEHVGTSTKDAGIVAAYAKRAAKAFAKLRLLVGDQVTDLVARKPWIVREMAAMEARRCGHVVPDGPTARAMTAVDALHCLEQSMAVVPLFEGPSLQPLQPQAGLRRHEAAEDGAPPVRRRLSYTDEGQGVLLCHNLR